MYERFEGGEGEKEEGEYLKSPSVTKSEKYEIVFRAL